MKNFIEVHFRHIVLYHFKKGESAADAYNQICDVYGATAIEERECEELFQAFGELINEGAARTRPANLDTIRMLKLVSHIPNNSKPQIAGILDLCRTTMKQKKLELKLQAENLLNRQRMELVSLNEAIQSTQNAEMSAPMYDREETNQEEIAPPCWHGSEVD